jgi:hypothetical protein
LRNTPKPKQHETMKGTQPKAPKIMLMRHAEKPAKDDAPYGVTFEGERSKESLEVRGWQRAGALTQLFAPANGRIPNVSLARPKFLFASKPLLHKGSRRPTETISPLAQKLRIKIRSRYARAELESMLEEVFGCKGPVLICWQREYLPQIAALILGKSTSVPVAWPEDRFDMIWVFDLNRASGKYRFKQVPQKLLDGDRPTPIR